MFAKPDFRTAVVVPGRLEAGWNEARTSDSLTGSGEAGVISTCRITPLIGQVAAPNLGRVLLRPTRAVEELHQVAATRTERRQIVKVGS
jgi:hypothetical protein